MCGFFMDPCFCWSQFDHIVAVKKVPKFGEVQSGPLGETINNSSCGISVGILDALGHVI